jgi:hypothetical protein
MTREEFIKILSEKGYPYETRDDGIIINNMGEVGLESLTELPEGIEFNNGGEVYLEGLTELPEGVKFNNGGAVYLEGLTELPEGAKFNNRGHVYLGALTRLPEGMELNNEGHVWLKNINTKNSIICQVPGVDSKRMMIVLVNKVQGNDEL